MVWFISIVLLMLRIQKTLSIEDNMGLLKLKYVHIFFPNTIYPVVLKVHLCLTSVKKKTNKQKPQYIELGIIPCDYHIANRENKDSFWQRLGQKKSHGLFVSYSPPEKAFFPLSLGELSRGYHGFRTQIINLCTSYVNSSSL